MNVCLSGKRRFVFSREDIGVIFTLEKGIPFGSMVLNWKARVVRRTHALSTCRLQRICYLDLLLRRYGEVSNFNFQVSFLNQGPVDMEKLFGFVFGKDTKGSVSLGILVLRMRPEEERRMSLRD